MELPTIKSNKQITYFNIEVGFDIETTSMKTRAGDKLAFMYVWMIGIGYGQPTYYGRTWEEFYNLCQHLQYHLKLNDKRRLVVYVHNLGYEFQFMRKYFDWTDVFSLSERKPIKAMCSLGIEFRDSYTLSGYSLANTAKNLTKYKVKKMEGDLDYNLIRHHTTPLTEKENLYCINDIQVILAYIKEQIEHSGNISLIPMTNTGRVRKYVRDLCYYRTIDGEKAGKGQYMRYRKVMSDLTIDPATYLQLKRSFMGGFTHANAHHSGKILEGVSSIDFTSSYPSVMVSEKFPMSRFRDVKITSLEQFLDLCESKAVVFDLAIENVRPKINHENYISESKCHQLKGATINNGRVSSADFLSTTLTEVDFDIMRQAYEWDSMAVTNVKYAHKAYLPKPIIESILKLYQGKTELKDVAGSEVEYMHSKGMLNSIYGMCVTDIVKPQATYEANCWGTQPVDVEETIAKYNESKNRFLYYAWGIWVTAYARRNLWTGITAVGDDYVYSDTDSLKVLNYDKHKPYVQWFDQNIISKMEAMCKHYNLNPTLLRPKTKDGVEKVLGIWDFEGTYDYFKTLGAKRYLTAKNGKLQLTVSGLSKRNGIEYMLEQAGGDILKVLESFDDDLYIPADRTGKMTHTYIDDTIEVQVTDYLGEVQRVTTESGIHLEGCEFTLSLSRQYLDFLKQLSQGYIFQGTKYV